MRPTHAPLPNPDNARRASGQADAEALATLKRTLLIAALETPPRFRSDIDVVIIQQYLASLGVLSSVSPQILHYLATECTINRIPDGEVIFYQEDAVDDHSHAYIILEGSLCGFFNKAFSQRHSREDFRSWNSKKSNAKGVTIDFGDLQVTYGKGAICGIDDFYPRPPARGRQHQKPLCRHRSVHSQEATAVILLAKDTLDRVSELFGFIYEKGVLTSSKETTRTDVSHLVIFSLLSDTARKTLLQTASTRQLEAGEVLFSADADKDSSMTAFAIVRNGRLDVHCVECANNQVPFSSNGSGNTPPASSSPLNKTLRLVTPKAPLVSLTRGHTFGDQMLALGLSHIWASNPRRSRQTNVRFKAIAGDSSTEILWITRDQYEQLVREDQLRLSYNPILGTAYTSSLPPSLISAIESRNIFQITRQLLTDTTLSKFFFQFPPLVIERLCHRMDIHHYASNSILREPGSSIDRVFIVVKGGLHTHYYRGKETNQTTAKKTLHHQGTARHISLGQSVQFIPGDAFGVRELMKRCLTCEAPVFADAGTTLLSITRSAFERWVLPMRHNIIVKAGSILQSFVWNNSSPPASPRRSYANNYAAASKVNRRQSGPSVFLSGIVGSDRIKERRLDDAAMFLKRFGLFPTVPRFLLAQMLTHATVVNKSAGEEMFREGDVQRALVVVLSGFVSFYSLENMSTVVDMFQKHPFCMYSTFSGSTINPEDFVVDKGVDENPAIAPSVALKHRAAMHGVHIQTLPYRNAFRTGVIQEGTVCPATVLAQTDCEYLQFDESLYARILEEHLPAVDMSDYNEISASSRTATPSDSKDPRHPPTPKSTTDQRPGTIQPPLLSYLEVAQIPWLPPSDAKKKLLLRSMHHVHLAPGQRLIQCNEAIQQVVLVVKGKLAAYVRESQEVISVLNASQRSVQSAALERSVASNYSTTSQQLYQDRSGVGTVNRRALQRKIARIAEIETSEQNSKSNLANSRFTDFVLHAAKESRKVGNTDDPQQQPHAPTNPPGTRRSLHSMVNKVKIKRKSDDQSTNNSSAKETTKALFMFFLGPGDIYGEEISSPIGIVRSAHDIYADTTIPGSPDTKETGSNRSLAGTEVLCLDRHVLHSILARTEEDVVNELSANAKAKWQIASKKLFKRASHSGAEETGEFIRVKKPPKLFDFFKNILNQRRFLTMGTIAHFPLLRDLTEDARRELCLNARFEALDRYTDAYKGNGDGNGTGHRFFLLLSGRINLVASGSSSNTVVSPSANSSTPDFILREVVAGEGFGEFEILIPEAPSYIAAIAAEPTKLLSIPAEMFMKHWPCKDEARGNIEYLRTRIPSFTSLDLERIAYLYHSFSFQSHVRGTSIIQHHDSNRALGPAAEVFLIKEGTCCIRQTVTLVSRSGAGVGYDPCEDERQPPRIKAIKVLATVADVSAGHIFWMDADHFPIIVVSTSASATIASISIDKLKAIVPRGMLSSLEDLSHQLKELYVQQFELAKRATATVMNEKLALLGQKHGPTQRLPNIHSPAAQSSTQSSSLSTQTRNTYDTDAFTANDTSPECIQRVNAEYNTQHRIERYEIPNELLAPYLVGSFLRKSASKKDDNSTPKLNVEVMDVQHKRLAGQVGLDDKDPVAGNAIIEQGSRRRMSSLSQNVDNVMTFIQDGFILYEVDVRERVDALMCMVGSPMRAMRLEPSHTAVNSLGKYFADCPSPFAKPSESYQRQNVHLEQSPRFHIKPSKHKPSRTPRSNPKLLQDIDAIPRQELTRKQGFLTCLRVRADEDCRDLLAAILPRIHQGRRFFYALVDSELREYADTLSLNNLAQTPCLRRYNLYNPHRSSSVLDVPVTSGEAEALLRQSFLLKVDALQFLFTASSAIDKQKWMAELNQAAVLGSVSIKVQSPRPAIAATPPTDPSALAAVIDAFKGRRKPTIKDRKRSSIVVPKPKPEDTLHVEYRIS
ncbi:hypothetical protein L917_05916 [Phytophthora nicotianae]|uniref:Cyclic nucleotide-binding domain-containing protein n=1 Tax=Phytophthora nicotianae TaxID=4792 RepID=W2LGV9_PHYNI|nr:hypothetical protein L917_05916 [Phytophthora nicotianae]